MLVQLTITALLARGHFLASPYWSDDSAEIRESINKAIAQDAADARLAPTDDTPLTAAQIPALRAALEFAATAQFDLAAAALVAHATSHPRAAESPWALRRAYLYWHALGRDTEATQTLHHYETHHAAREPRAAAEFFWSRRDHLEPAQRRDHLRKFLKRQANHAPPDLRIAAEAELAADLWRSSCTRTWHGLCVDFTWATRKVTCALGHAPLFTVRPRDATSHEALRLAASATRRGLDLDLTRVAPWRRPALRAALGQAALVTTDAALETLVALEFPRNLDFYVEEYKNTPEVSKWQKEYREQVRRRDDSTRRFHRYWTAYNALSRAALHRTNALYAAGSPRASLLGMTHLALVIGEVQDESDFTSSSSETFEQLVTPDSFTFCHPNERSGPILTIANHLLKTCATLVRTSGIYDPDLAVCFDGFSRLYGAEDPLPEFSPA